jgi:acetyltransferase-like isoleucine patch superfamily enzyme
MSSRQVDLHSPNPLSTLVTRELRRISSGVVWSAIRRVQSLSSASYIHWRGTLVQARGIAIGGHCQIHSGAILSGRGSRSPALRLGRYVIVREHAYVDPHGGWIELDDGVFVGQNAVVYGQGGVTVGRNALLSPGVTVLTAEHALDDNRTPIKFQPETCSPVRIGEDCWIGANVTILAGVTIGDGTVVGAGSVVTKDLPPGVVAVGVPARVVRTRGEAVAERRL